MFLFGTLSPRSEKIYKDMSGLDKKRTADERG
jgi:hypothetical protein